MKFPLEISRRSIALALTALLGATACGGSGGGGDALPAATQSRLTGTWYGTEEQTNGTLVALRVTIDGTRLTQIVVDGTGTGLTGSISANSNGPNFFDFVLSDGTEGGFFLESQGDHVVFLDEEFNFGVLQKNATNLPNVGQTDIFGSTYDGVTVILDGSMTITDVLTSNVQIFPDGSFQGSNSSGTQFTSATSLSLTNGTFGAWAGAYESTGPQGPDTGPVRVFASPDKQFIGSWACSAGGTFPEDCSFSVWRAQ